MQKQIPQKTTSSEADIQAALVKSQEAFSSAYEYRNGTRKNSYALLARQNFDSFILDGAIYPEDVEDVLENDLDFFLEEARAEEKSRKDQKFDMSFEVIHNDLSSIREINKQQSLQITELLSINKEQSLRIKELLAINEEQSGSIAELASNNKELIALANEAKQDAKESKAELKETRTELKETRAELQDSERKNKKSNFIYFAAGALVSAALTFAPMVLQKEDVPEKSATLSQPKEMICHRQKFETCGNCHAVTPIATGNGKEPEPILDRKCLSFRPANTALKAQL